MKTKAGLIKITGYIILSISCLLFILIPVVPWFDFSAGQKAGISAGLLIAGEILFYLSLFILGRSFFDKIKSRLKFRKTKTSNTDISAQR
ncbi:MAG: transporter suffix domain-containing protein [Ignavibacteria bacterium]|nr:transporter suffix domain-containing protein [Ignavibacteria bacterium]